MCQHVGIDGYSKVRYTKISFINHVIIIIRS